MDEAWDGYPSDHTTSKFHWIQVSASVQDVMMREDGFWNSVRFGITRPSYVQSWQYLKTFQELVVPK